MSENRENLERVVIDLQSATLAGASKCMAEAKAVIVEAQDTILAQKQEILRLECALARAIGTLDVIQLDQSLSSSNIRWVVDQAHQALLDALAANRIHPAISHGGNGEAA